MLGYTLLSPHPYHHRRQHVCHFAHGPTRAFRRTRFSGAQEDKCEAPLPHVGQGSGDGDEPPPRAAPAECWDGSPEPGRVASETAADVSRRGWPCPPAGGGPRHRRRGRGSLPPAVDGERARESVAPGARALTWRCRSQICVVVQDSLYLIDPVIAMC